MQESYIHLIFEIPCGSYIQYTKCTLAKLSPLSHLSYNYEDAIKFLWNSYDGQVMLVTESTRQHCLSIIIYFNNCVLNFWIFKLIIYISLLGSRWLSCCVCIYFDVSHTTLRKFQSSNGNQMSQSPRNLKHGIHLKSETYLLIAFRLYWIASITPLNSSSFKIRFKKLKFMIDEKAFASVPSANTVSATRR